MASRRSRPRRFMLPILLAAVLAAEITGIAIARSIAPSETGASAADAAISPATVSAGRLLDDIVSAAPAEDAQRDPRALRQAAPAVIPVSPPAASGAPATPAPSSHVRAVAPKSASPVMYAGRNHVWIPSLGINRQVNSFPCSRTRPPDNELYRWGCAGNNNVYLLGHAYSVFKPLHDAYVSGRLRKGMKVVYADGLGRVHTYSVIWWRVVAPTTAASWAWAAQSRPSMTLQTCLGATSQYRLMVRLVQSG
ncbi:MAG TPA: sortase [Candidatus Bathyarchaeia archaeon]|nr:sortase [Candidatus Bathyarchaeia archaeon]